MMDDKTLDRDTRRFLRWRQECVRMEKQNADIVAELDRRGPEYVAKLVEQGVLPADSPYFAIRAAQS